MVLCLSVSTMLFTGCGNNTSSTTTESSQSSTADSESEDSVIYGEIASIEEDSITINVGTQKEMEKPEQSEDSSDSDTKETKEASTDETTEETTEDSDATSESKTENESESADSQDNQKQDKPEEPGSMLELTGEQQTISITDDTTFEQQNAGGGGNMGGAPEKPDGDSGEAPEKPDGDSSEVPEKPDENSKDASDSEDTSSFEDTSDTQSEDDAKTETDSDKTTEDKAPQDDKNNESEEIAFSDLKEGDTVAITLDSDGKAKTITVMTMGGGAPGQMGGQASGVDSYEAENEYSEDTEVDGETLTSTGTDENTVHVLNNAVATIKNSTISRESSDSTGGDNSSFYGVGAALLTTEGTTYISNSEITTDSAGGAGLFAYGNGTIYAADTTINTTQDTSGGIHAAGGGTLYAWDVSATTNGTSSAAVRSDRGGGTMVIDGGDYTSNGSDSPAVYCTADIAINDADLTANNAEAVCIEGLNTLHLYDCNLTGTMPDDDRNDCTWNVILYQSMSGDSEVGNSTFEMNGGTLNASNGGIFYTTNTESTITLSNVEITYPEENDFFLKCTGNQNQRGWGKSGANGADCLFTAINQEMEGDVIWDSISQLDFYATQGSTLKGGFVNDESCVSETGDGYANLVIDEDSTWIVTKDSTLSTLENAGTIVDESGNIVTIKGEDGTVYVEGDSEYTVTVKEYKTSADTSKASTSTSWSDHEVEKPEELA